MRNLKKVLALVLAMAMSLSLAVTAGAAFNDQDKIVNTEAVDMCVALNIINGRTNGDFDPAGNVTRAEAAKMICIALNGGKEPVLSASATPIFADIAGHWAAKYIEYCVSEGIVAGKSATSFDPNGNVTGVELAKMLLIGLGYNAEHGKFLGANWDTNVNVAASQKDLYEGLETVDPSVALSRDNAAQMIWNALQAKEVEYEYTLVTENGQLVSKVTVKDDTDCVNLMTCKYGTTSTVGVMNDAAYDTEEAVYEYAIGGTTFNFESDTDYSDLYKQKVEVIHKTVKGEVVVYGIVAEDSSVIASGTLEDIELVSDDSAKVEIADVEYKLTGTTAQVAFNKVFDGNYSSALNNVAAMLAYSGNEKMAGYTFDLIDNTGDDKGDIIVVYPFSVEQVTYVGTKGITAGAGYTFEDDNIYEGVAKDDYVVITAAANCLDGKDCIEKADVTTVKVTGTKAGSVQIDGAWYTKAVSTSMASGEEYDVVMINDVIYAAEPVDTASKDVLFVSAVKSELNTEFDSDDVSVDVKAWFTDGKGEVITVSKVAGNDVSAQNTAAPNTLYTYKVVDGAYELTAVSSTNDAGYDAYVAGTTGNYYNNEKLAATRVADDAVIFVVDGTDVEVITGAALKDWGNTTYGTSAAVLANESNGVNYAKVGFVVGANGTPDALSDINYGFVVAEPWDTTVEDDGEDVAVVAVQVWTGSEIATLYVKGGELAELDETFDAGMTVSYKTDGLYVAVNGTDLQLDAAGTLAAITGFEYVAEGDVVYTDGTKNSDGSVKYLTYALDEDVVFIGINTEDVDACEAIEMADIQLAQSQAQNTVAPNAYVVTDTVNGVTTVIAIFMDIFNEVEGATAFAK